MVFRNRSQCLHALVFTLLVLAGGFGTAFTAQGQGLNSLVQEANAFLPVEEAYHLEIEQVDATQIRLYWQIEQAYYLYQHRFKVALADEQGAIATELSYSPALAKTDEFFGDVEVYYDYADLGLTTERSFGVARLAVTSQGCADAGLCYPPHTEIFSLDGTTGVVSRGEPNLSGDESAASAANKSESSADPITNMSLANALLFAFLGGLILNAMPCVFPILSLKVLSFATGDPTSHHRHAWWYLTGVVASFVASAIALISLQSLGQFIGWGFQLQSTGFVIALAYLFTAMGLGLSGVVQLGSGFMNLGNTLAGGQGYRSSFFTGVLAVVVASPCTAPFMGSALGFALTQPSGTALLIFVALGLGMAAPMVLLSYSRAARQLLPKPGPWMETLKEVLAFPLYATAVWLLWVAGNQSGVDTMAAALGGLVLLALGLWLYRGSWRRKSLALVSLVLAILLGMVRGEGSAGDARLREGTVAWSPTALEQLRDDGIPVFVDVTADWCITCKANEQAVLFTDSMTALFKDHGVVYMIADWTDYDEAIGALVRSHRRNGIPLYVMYPAAGKGEPFILPQLLTTTVMTEALQKVSTASRG